MVEQNKYMFTISPFGRSRCCNYIQRCLGQTSLGTSASTSSSTSATGGISIFRRRCFSSWCFSLSGCCRCHRTVVVTERPIIVVILPACARPLEDSNSTRVNIIEQIILLLVRLQNHELVQVEDFQVTWDMRWSKGSAEGVEDDASLYLGIDAFSRCCRTNTRKSYYVNDEDQRHDLWNHVGGSCTCICSVTFTITSSSCNLSDMTSSTSLVCTNTVWFTKY